MPWGWWGRRSSRLCSTGCCWCCSCCWRGGRRWRWCAASAGGCSRSGGRPAAGSPLPARVCWTPGKRVGLVRRRRAGVGRSDRTEPNRTEPNRTGPPDQGWVCGRRRLRLRGAPLAALNRPRSGSGLQATIPTAPPGVAADTKPGQLGAHVQPPDGGETLLFSQAAPERPRDILPASDDGTNPDHVEQSYQRPRGGSPWPAVEQRDIQTTVSDTWAWVLRNLLAGRAVGVAQPVHAISVAHRVLSGLPATLLWCRCCWATRGCRRRSRTPTCRPTS